MHLSLFLLILLLFSACTTTPDVNASRDNFSKNKILINQSAALHAQNEYKMLQEQRRNEKG